jgi:hypothetical protein
MIGRLFVTALSFSAVCVAAASAAIEVTYQDVPEAAQADFKRAAEIWSGCLVSDVPINVHVTWIQNGPTGFALPNGVRNESHLPVQNVWYPTALSNALRGARVDDTDDMNIFLREKDNWYYTQETEIAEGEVDFINVALHEIAHGLGISSGTFTPWQGDPISSIGLPNEFISYFSWTFDLPELDGTPMLYDTFLTLGDGRTLMEFPNPSLELTYALANPTLNFAGETARRANGDYPVAVTPLSVSHIPQFPRRASPIMLSDSGQGETRHKLDAILLGMMQDLGWEISETCLQGAP